MVSRAEVATLFLSSSVGFLSEQPVRNHKIAIQVTKPLLKLLMRKEN